MRGTGSLPQWKADIKVALDLLKQVRPETFVKANCINVDAGATAADIDRAMHFLLKQSTQIGADIEAGGLRFRTDNVINLGLCVDATKTTTEVAEYFNADVFHVHDYRTFSHNNDPVHWTVVFEPASFGLLKPYLEDPAIDWCWQNGKFDIKFFRQQYGIEARVDNDTMLMSYALDETRGIHDLETISKDRLHAPDYKDMLQPYLPNKRTSYNVIPRPVLDEYLADDASRTIRSAHIMRSQIQKDLALDKLYTRTLIPASEMLQQVERNGFYIDQERLNENEVIYQAEIEHEKAAINKLLEEYDVQINPGSPQQVAKVLYDVLKFPNRFKNGTDKDTIKKLMEMTDGHPFLIALSKFRKAQKMYGTYVKGLRRWIHDDGRIHSTYKIHGTVTGRLASAEPNAQNPPRQAQIRGSFMAEPGNELIECDLSQAELRSLAALSGDPELVRVYCNGEDLHSDLAVSMFENWAINAHSKDKALKALAKEQRVKCKNVNFGIVYGITEFGLMEQMNSTVFEARDMLAGWARRYAVAHAFIEKCRMAPARQQTLVTCFGRKKRVGVVSRGNINFLMNESANFPHQSIASDITLHTAIKVWRTLLARGVKIVNLVHDSIIMEAPITSDNSLRWWVMDYVTSEMARTPIEWGIERVPFVSDPDYGSRWGSLTEMEKSSSGLWVPKE